MYVPNSRLFRLRITGLLLVLAFAVPVAVSAHQPRLTEGRITAVTDPETSKAYYATLTGEPDTYVIRASKPFDLYLNVLVPDIAGQQTDITAVVRKDGADFTVLDGTRFQWKPFFEPFGHDAYLMGPEFKARAEAGEYEIRVSSTNNDRKYSLAVGEKEFFDTKEGMQALSLIPKLKRDFFNESPIGFILSPFGWGLILAMYVLGFAFGLAYRAILKRFAKSAALRVHENIGKPDRLFRLLIAVGLLLWAVTTSWSPLLLFFSGFTLFEAVFSWCGVYAAAGKNTCPS